VSSLKFTAGAPFPSVSARGLDGAERDGSTPRGEHDWMMLIVYRGRHCPLCTRYLNELEQYVERLGAIGVDVAAVSADSAAQLESHLPKLEVTFPLFYGLTLEQMQELGVYVSHPRSPKETDHPFAEPGLFVVNASGALQVTDISNNPFVRPALDKLVSGLEWIRDPENDYPIRGTYAFEG